MRRSQHLYTVVVNLVLCGVLLVWGSAAWAAERGNDANGKKLYLTYCFTCHGKEGEGDGYAASVQPVKPRDLTDNAVLSTRTDEQLFQAISEGSSHFRGPMVMPAWWQSLTEQQLWDLVAYVRTLHQKQLLDLPWQDWQGRWPDCRDLQATTPRPGGSGVSLHAYGSGPVQRHQSGRRGRRAFPHHAWLGGGALASGDLGSRRVCPSILKTAMTFENMTQREP